MTYHGSVVLEKKIKWPHLIFVFLWLSPLWRTPDPLFNKLEFLLPKDDLYQVWFKFTCWFRRGLFWKFSVFLLFCYYISPGKGFPLHLTNLESPLPQDDLCRYWLKLAQLFWSRSKKNPKIRYTAFHPFSWAWIREHHWTLSQCRR
jgi:hypothetical protein